LFGEAMSCFQREVTLTPGRFAGLDLDEVVSSFARSTSAATCTPLAATFSRPW
jgi:hypothetical protein